MRQNNVWLKRKGERKKANKRKLAAVGVGMLKKDAQTVLLRVENLLVLVGAEEALKTRQEQELFAVG